MLETGMRPVYVFDGRRQPAQCAGNGCCVLLLPIQLLAGQAPPPAACPCQSQRRTLHPPPPLPARSSGQAPELKKSLLRQRLGKREEAGAALQEAREAGDQEQASASTAAPAARELQNRPTHLLADALLPCAALPLLARSQAAAAVHRRAPATCCPGQPRTGPITCRASLAIPLL
jgi:hypothetical protein